MRQSLPILALPILALLLLLAAGSAHAQSDLLFASGFETGSATVGPAGGLVPGPDGVRLIVDEGSLSSAVTFRIAADATGAPPLPSGIELAGSIYAVTPHGTGFDATAVVELPVPAGSGPLFLVKGEPGNPRWSVVAQAGAPGPVLRSGVESLSYFALGRCSPTLPAGVCPAGHTLSLELLDGSSTIPIDYDNPQPVLLVTTPTLLTFRMRWTRPPFTQRTDTIDTGNANQSGVLGRTVGFAFGPAAPRFEQASGNVDRIFGVTVTPALVDGAADQMRGGTVRRIWAQANYANFDPPFAQAWDFDTFIPIRVYDPTGATAPFEITSQPQDLTVPIGQPATFTVATNLPPATFLTYYWFRVAGANGQLSPIANARTASYTTPPTTPADNGARFRVQVCSTRPLRCLLSEIATLGVGAPLPPNIIQQPANAAVTEFATASFTVLAEADQSLEIAWERSNDVGNSWIAAGPGVPITDGSRLDIATQLTDDGALFRAEACNVAGVGRTCVYSNEAALSVSPSNGAPVITQQPQPQSTVAGGSARFEVIAVGNPAPAYSWTLGPLNLPSTNNATFVDGGCALTVQYENARAVLRLRTVSTGCNGREVRVRAGNNILPDAISQPALLTVVPDGGSAQPGWTAPAVVLDWGTGIDLPQAEPLLEGAVVNVNGILRLLGVGRDFVPPPAVAGRPFVAARSSVYQWVLFRGNTPNSTCGPFSGNQLNAIGLFRDPEGVTSISPTLILHESGACIFDVAAAGSLQGVAWAMTQSTGGAPRVGRFDQTYNRSTQTWTSSNLGSQLLATSGDCASPRGFSERALAGPSAITVPGPTRSGVLGYESRPGSQSFACAASLSSSGTWSTAESVRALGALQVGDANVVVAMDASGNSVLAGNRGIGTQWALFTASLPVADVNWTQESEFPLLAPVLPDLGASPSDARALLAWRNPPSLQSAFTTVFAVYRAAAGTWGPVQRLLAEDRDTRFPRVTMGTRGTDLVTFQALDNGRFRVMGARSTGGAWQTPGWIQPPGGAEGRFAVAPRYWFLGTSFDALEFLPVYWRETDPGDASRFRIVRAVPAR